MDTASNLFRKHRRLIFFLLGIIVVFWLLWVLRSAILPFVFGLVLAYLLAPFISWAEDKLPRQGRWLAAKRVFLIALIFIVILGLVGFFSYYIVNAVINAMIVLLQNTPDLISGGLTVLQDWTENLRLQFPPEMREQVDAFILDASTELGNAIQGFLVRGISAVPSTFSLMFGFFALPLFLFYLLKDSEKLNRDFYSALSPWLAEHTRNIISIIERVLGRYIRAQLVLALIVGYFSLIGLLILRVDFAPALAAVAAVTELIPIIGPWIGGIFAVIVTLAIAPDKAIWVAVLFLLVQLLENNLLVPRIQGGYLRLHPAVTIVLLVLGAYVAGFWGIVLAAPLAATIVEIYRYMRQTVQSREAESSVGQ